MPILKRKKILSDIFLLDAKRLDRFLKNKNSVLTPLVKANKATKKDFYRGKKILFEAKCFVIIMAAGQGTRLGINTPKGLVEVGKKSLFEHLIEKIKKKQALYGKKIFLSIMTSSINHLEIVRFFEKKAFFGLEKNQIDFFRQEEKPFFDKSGFWIVKNEKILKAPSGNGAIFKSFYNSYIFEKYKLLKCKYVSVVPIDNIFNDPLDENFLGFHKRYGSEVSLKCLERKTQDEKKGALALDENGKVKVIEYIHLDKNKKYYFSNSGIYVFNFKFFENTKDVKPEYNFVLKKMHPSFSKMAFKAESFIFDIFPYAQKVGVMKDAKENFYFPIKDFSDLQKVEKLVQSN